MQSHSGWYLPSKDNYFQPFLKEEMGNMNGFQLDHLHAALKHVNNFDVALDIGAHVGFWARTMAEKFKQVHAFEPSPDTFECLQRNITSGNVTLNQAGMGHEIGTCSICEDPKRMHNTGSRFIQPQGDIPMVTIDSLNLNACDFVKIDVEGFEYQVLLGGQNTLRKFKPVVIMETDKKFALRRYGVGDQQAEIYLQSLGYQKVEHMRPDTIFVC